MHTNSLLTSSSHCVDADETYDVSLALESEEAHSHSEENGHDHAHESESSSATEITEVTGCHAHTDTLFCMAGGEEWEVQTDVDVANAPDGYSGCHAHGEDEL